MLTSDGKCFKNEVQRRFAIAKDTFNKMSPILKNRNIGIGLGTKLSALKTYVQSTLLYGCESWTITNDVRKRLEAAEMWFLRRILRK